VKLRLEFTTGQHTGQVLEFQAPRTLILGRSSQADLQIYDERISRRHCALRIDNDGARLKDMGSGNGTFLNGKEIREIVLTTGDTVALGRTEFKVTVIALVLPGTQVSHQQPVAPTVDMRGGRAPANTECAFCHVVIPPDQLHLAVEHRGRFLCVRCVPRVEVPGYQIEHPLGEGAMGVVYLATDPNGRTVALKVLKTRGELSAEDRARFVREANTAASLQHPNIVQVLTHGQSGPYLYFVMEYVTGKSLKQWIDQHGALPLPSVLRVAVQVAKALSHARDRHIVHRDIKPENIIVQDDGHSKLADFGLAKNTMSSGNSGLTRPGDGLGTLPYMPPEQIEDALFADHRSDIYSFGATVFHMLTGRPPFMARTPLEFFNSIRRDAPPQIEGFRSDVPQVLITMLNKCLNKKPEDRYQQIDDVIMILEQFLRSEFDSRQTAS
jgi:serine/threonine-protein kinase